MMEWLQLGAPLTSAAHWYLNRDDSPDIPYAQEVVELGKVAFGALSLYEIGRFMRGNWEASPQFLIRQGVMPLGSLLALGGVLYKDWAEEGFEQEHAREGGKFHLMLTAALSLALTPHPGIAAAASALAGQFLAQDDPDLRMDLGLASFAIGASLITADLMQGMRLLSPLQHAQTAFNVGCTLAGGYLFLEAGNWINP